MGFQSLGRYIQSFYWTQCNCLQRKAIATIMKKGGLEKADPNSINGKPKKRRLLCKSFCDLFVISIVHFSANDSKIPKIYWKHFLNNLAEVILSF